MMTHYEKQLIAAVVAGNNLARRLGHAPGCPKLSPAVPCSCVATKQQAQALDEWERLVREIQSGIENVAT
jgi:hypothetical protein